DNTGSKITVDNATIFMGWRSNASQATSIVGGTVEGNGLLRNLGAAKLQDLSLGAGLTLTTENKAVTTVSGAKLQTAATNKILAGGTFVMDPATDYLQSGGATVLEGGSLTAPKGLQIAGELRGSGTITGNVRLDGEVNLEASSGLKVVGDYTQSAGGRMTIGLSADATHNGRLSVTGNAALDGSLMVLTPVGFRGGQQVNAEVLTFATRTGSFTEYLASQSGPEYSVLALFGPSSLVVQLNSMPLAVGGPAPQTLRFYSRGAAFALELPEASEVR